MHDCNDPICERAGFLRHVVGSAHPLLASCMCPPEPMSRTASKEQLPEKHIACLITCHDTVSAWKFAHGQKNQKSKTREMATWRGTWTLLNDAVTKNLVTQVLQ